MAEGEGFEPSIPITRDKRLAGARTRPLCDPSGGLHSISRLATPQQGVRHRRRLCVEWKVNPLRWLVRRLISDDDAPADDDPVLLAEPDGEMVAGMWQGILEQRGINSMIKNVNGIAHLRGGVPMFEMYVRHGDLAEARELLGLDTNGARVAERSDEIED